MKASLPASVFLSAPVTTSVDEASKMLLLLACTAMALVVLGVWWTRYRYVLAYFVAGMAYWLVVEGVHWGVVRASSLADTPAYVLALAITFVPLAWSVSLPTADMTLPSRSRKPRRRKHTLPFIGLLKRWQRRARPLPQHIGERPILLKKDTQFYQRVIRHRPVMDVER